MDIADILNISGAYFPVGVKSPFPIAHDRFRDGNPGVVMAEDAGVFFVSARI